MTSGLIKESDLEKLKIWGNIYERISRKYAKIDGERKKYLIIRSLIDIQVTDLIEETEIKIVKNKIKSHLDVKNTEEKLAAFSKEMMDLRRPLREFLIKKLYCHYRVVRMSNKAKRFIQELFNVYIKSPEQLPPQIEKRVAADGVRRAVCDYIAGMTDRYALDEYKKLFDPYEKV